MTSDQPGADPAEGRKASMTSHKRGRGGRTTKRQENVDILSHTVFCIAASLIKSIAKNCDASNEN
jgi:hypothetical protein